jgi:hypothetical protein
MHWLSANWFWVLPLYVAIIGALGHVRDAIAPKHPRIAHALDVGLTLAADVWGAVRLLVRGPAAGTGAP